MPRIPPDRTGYSGYSCVGISEYLIPECDCAGPNRYLKLPILMVGGVSDKAWEDTSAIDDDPRLDGYCTTCGLDFDPFEGTQIDLYQSFLDNGLGGLIEDTCVDEYPTGYLNPVRSADLRGCSDAGEGGAIPPAPPPVDNSSSSVINTSTSSVIPCDCPCSPWPPEAWPCAGLVECYQMSALQVQWEIYNLADITCSTLGARVQYRFNSAVEYEAFDTGGGYCEWRAPELTPVDTRIWDLETETWGPWITGAATGLNIRSISSTPGRPSQPDGWQWWSSSYAPTLYRDGCPPTPVGQFLPVHSCTPAFFEEGGLYRMTITLISGGVVSECPP